MNRLALIGLGITMSLAAACADLQPQLYILQNQKPDTGCIAPTGTQSVTVSSGTLDVTQPLPNKALNPGYIFTPLAANDAAVSASNPSLHMVFVQGADVELQALGTSQSQSLISALSSQGLAKRTQRFTVTIGAKGSAGFAYPLIDSTQTTALDGILGDNDVVQILAHTTLFGQVDGGSIVSPAFEYPITVCRGCLWNSTSQQACGSVTGTINTGGICNPLQDATLTCCTAAVGGLTCPAI